MAFCPNCGSKIGDNAKFCTECGTKIEAPKPVTPAEPVQPVYAAPAAPQPVYEAPPAPPAQPVYEAPPAPPVQPVYEAPPVPPAQPVYEAPAAPQPVYEAPAAAQPVYTAPAAPAEPVREAPVKPAPAQPACKAAAKSAASVPSGGPDREKRPVNKKLFLFGGIALAVVLVVVILIIALAGGGNVDEALLGKYVAVSCTANGADKAVDGEWIELQAKGKAEVYIFGKEYEGKWKLKGEDFTLTQGGDDFEGSLKNGKLTLDFSGQVFTYEKEGEAAAPEKPAETPKPEDKATEEGYWVLHHTEGAEALTPEDVEEFAQLGLNIYVVLNEDGSGVFCMDEPVNVKWAKGKISADGESIAYTFQDDTFSFELEGTTYIFSRGKGTPPMTAAPETPEETPEATPDLPDEGTGPYEWWEGEWYGWWIVETGYGVYESWEGSYWDTYARIEAYDDDTGYLTLWDVDTDLNNPLAEMGISFGSGVTEHGAMINEEGYFMDYEMEHADFVCDPGVMGFEIEDMICIDFRYYDPTDDDSYIDVYIFLRPWGMYWDDIEGKTDPDWYYSDMMPMYYNEWYKPLVDAGYSLPSSYQNGLELIGGNGSSTPSDIGGSGLSATPPGTGDILADALWDDCGVEIVGAEYFVDAMGEDAIRIFFNFFNCSDGGKSAAEMLTWNAYQGGTMLSVTNADYEKEAPEYGNDWLYIRPAIKIGCCAEYTFDPDAGNIEIVFENYWGNGETVKYSFDPYDLPGRPPELGLMPITWPVWIMNVPEQGSLEGECAISIRSAQIVDGYYGDCIRFYVDFTNLSSEDQSPFWATTIIAYQDGVEMPVTYNVNSVDEDLVFYDDVAPGQTVTFSMCYELRSESPIEFEVRGFWGDLIAGVINYLN